MWDNYGGGSIRPGFGDLSEVVNYLTSHDVEAKPRLMNALFGDTLRYRGLGDGGYAQVRSVNADLAHQSPEVSAAFADAIDWVRSAFAILLTSVPCRPKSFTDCLRKRVCPSLAFNRTVHRETSKVCSHARFPGKGMPIAFARYLPTHWSTTILGWRRFVPTARSASRFLH